MAFDPKAHLAKLKAQAESQQPAPQRTPQKQGFDPKAHLAKLQGTTMPPEGAPPSRFPNARQRGRMDQMGSAEERVGDLVGGLNTAILDVVDLPSTVYNMGMDVTGNESLKVPPTMSALRPYVAERSETMKNADNPLQDFFRTFGEWGGGVGAMQRGVSKAADVGMAGGAATGEAVGGETGELVGGVTGAFSPAALNKLFGDVGADGKTLEIVDFLRGKLGEQGEQNLREAAARGEVGTMGDLSRTQEVNTVEAALANERPQAADAFRESADARAAQVGEQFDDTLAPAGTNTTVPQEQVASRLTQTRRALDETRNRRIAGAEDANAETLAQSRAVEDAAMAESRNARAASQEADTALGGEMRTDEASTRFANEYRRLDDDLREQVVRPAWQRFEEVKEFETKQLQEDLSKFSEDMPAYLREDLNSQYKTLMNKLQNMESIADPRDIQYVLSSIKQANREARANNAFGPLNKQLGEVQNIVDTALANGERIGPRFQDAIAATMEQKTRMGGKRVGKGLAVADEDPELFVRNLGGFKGDNGASVARVVNESGDEGVINAAQEALRSELRRTKMTEDVLTQYEPALARFPEVKADVTRAVANRQTMAEAEKAAASTATEQAAVRKEADSLLKNSIDKARTRAGKVRDKTKGFVLTKFANKPNEFIDSALSAKDDTGDLGRIYRRFAKDGEEYGEAFKSKVLGRLKDDIMAADRIEGGLTDKLQRLMDNGIVTDANRQEVIDIIAMQEGRRQRRLVRSGGRSALDPQGSGQDAIDDGVSTALTLPLLSMLPSSHQLMAAGMLKRNFRRLIKSKRLDPERLQKLTELMNGSPEKFIDLMDRKITTDTKPEELTDIFERAMVKAGIMSGQAPE